MSKKEYIKFAQVLKARRETILAEQAFTVLTLLSSHDQTVHALAQVLGDDNQRVTLCYTPRFDYDGFYIACGSKEA